MKQLYIQQLPKAFLFSIIVMLSSFTSIAQSADFSFPSDTACINTNFTIIDNSTGATTYSWSFGNGASPVTSVTGGNQTVQWSSDGFKIISLITDEGTANESTKTEVLYVVNGVPAASGAVSGIATSCANSTGINYSISPVARASNYAWDISVGDATIASVSSTSAFVNAGVNNFTVRVTPQNACGNATSSTRVVTVNNVPANVASITGNTSVCVNDVVTYSVASVAGVTYTWTTPGGVNIMSGQGTSELTVSFPNNTANGQTISVLPSNSCGNAANNTSTAVLAINQRPVNASAFTASEARACRNTVATFTIPTSTGATSYIWSLPTGVTVGGSGNSEIVSFSATAVSGVITVVPTNSCGDAQGVTTSVVVEESVPAAAGAITGQNTVCQNATAIQYSVPPVVGATSYLWEITSGNATIASSNGNFATVDAQDQNFTLRVTPQNDCGNGTASTLNVTVNTAPATPSAIIGTTTACVGEIRNYSVTSVAGLTYEWTVPAGSSILSGATSNAISLEYTALTANGNQLSVRAVNSCGNSPLVNTAILTINDKPANAAAFSASSSEVCANTDVQFTIPVVDRATSYVWSLPAGVTAPGTTNSELITFSNTASSGTVSVTPTNACGTGMPRTIAVNVNLRPTALLSGATTICNGQSAKLTVAFSGRSPWNFDLNGQNYNSATATFQLDVTPTTNTDYQITNLTDDNSCQALAGSNTQTVVVNALPTVSFTLNSDYEEGLLPLDLLTTNPSPVGGVFSGNGVVSSNNLFIGTNPIANPYTITYTYTDGNNCVGIATQNTNIGSTSGSINGLSDEVYCAYETPINVSGTPAGGSFELDNVAIGAGDNIILDFAAIDKGNHVLKYIHSGGLETTRSFRVDLIEPLDFTTLPVGGYCVDEGIVLLTADPLTTSSTGGVHTFTGPGGSGFVNLGQNALLYTNIIGATAGTNITYRYTIPSAKNCFGETTQILLINDLPVVDHNLASGYNISDAAVTLVGSPAGGTFSGNITGANTFDPASLGVGGPYAVSYEYTDANGCTNSITKTTSVQDADVTITGIPSNKYFCKDATPATLTGIANNSNGDPGNFSIDGTPVAPSAVNQIIFDPSNFTAGNHIITYTYTSSLNATLSFSETITIDSIGAISFTTLNPAYCVNVSEIQVVIDRLELLSTGTGAYSGAVGILPTGAGRASLIPSIIIQQGNAQDTVRYEYTRTVSGCKATTQQFVRINPLPNVSFSLNPVYSVTDSPVSLNESPAGATGVFSGNGINSGTKQFEPTTAGIGSHTISYTYTSPTTGCVNSTQRSTTVNEGLAFIVSKSRSGNQDNKIYCFDGVQDTLIVETLNRASVGTFVFSPAAGYTELNDSTFIFNPAIAGAGSSTVTYNYQDANGDAFQAQSELRVDRVGPVDFTGLSAEYCIDANQVSLRATDATLTSTLDGTPGLGSSNFSSTSAGIFDAGKVALYNIADAGLTGGTPHQITFNYRAAVSGCRASVTKNTLVHPLPVIDLDIRLAYNVTEQDLMLTATPAGGVFSGNGLQSSGSFSPSLLPIGQSSVSYTYTDANGCSNIATQQIDIVEAFGSITGIQSKTSGATTFPNLYCYDDDANIITGVPTGGLPGGTFEGPGITDLSNDQARFDPTLAGPGNHAIRYRYEDAVGVLYTITEMIQVDSIGEVDFIGLSDQYCADAPVANLVALTFANGTNTFSGIPIGAANGFVLRNAGIIADLTPANIPNKDTDLSITFTYTAPNTCQSSITKTTRINTVPVIDFTLREIHNITEGPQELLPVQTNPNSTNGIFEFTGRGVDGFQFKPELFAVADTGNYVITMRYTDTEGTFCTATRSKSTLMTAADADFAIQDIYCYTDVADTIQAFVIDNIIGVFSGDGVTNLGNNLMIFDPVVAGEGMHTVTFSYVKDGVDFDVSKEVWVDRVLPLDFVGLANSYCRNDSPVELTAVSQNTGGVGVFTGNGMMGTFFDPSIAVEGNNTIRYTFIRNATSCSLYVEKSTTLNPQPEPSFVLENQFCLNEPTVVVKGTPSGGRFSGLAIQLIDEERLDSVFFEPRILNQNVIRYDYTDTNTGCSNFITQNVTVNPRPFLAFTELATQYCNDQEMIQLNGTVNGVNIEAGSFTGSVVYEDINASGPDISPNGRAYFIPQQLNLALNDTVFTIKYFHTDPITGCSDTTSRTVRVRPLPNVNVGISGIRQPSYCSDVNIIPLQGTSAVFPQNGRFDIESETRRFVVDADTYNWNPAVDRGNVIIRYTFTNEHGCSNTAIDNTVIFPAPVASFSLLSSCSRDSITFINNTVSEDAIESYLWNFGDPFAGINNTDTIETPKHKYATPGDKLISLRVTTVSGCSNTDSHVESIGKQPENSFSWINECFDINSPTTFINETDTTGLFVENIIWDFGDGNVVNSLIRNNNHQYTSSGEYDVALITNTKFGCEDTLRQLVTIRDYIDTYPYTENFETGRNGWVPETADSLNSWIHGSIIRSGQTLPDNLAWSTGAEHRNNEKSWVVGPCFNLSVLEKPMIKMNIWSATEARDGVILQYTTRVDATEADWQTIGDIGTGIGWYNANTIEGLGGRQIGWTGIDNNWREVRHDLDMIPVNQRAYVRFRIYFGANATITQEGFAFDNVWIGDRNKIVVLEHFTSTRIPNIGALDQQVENIVSRFDRDMVDIHYHVPTFTDELYNQFPAGPNARSLYYGVAQAPHTVFEGNVYNGTTNPWLVDTVNTKLRTLLDPLFDMRVTASESGDVFQYTVVARSSANIPQAVRLRIALVEDNVTLPSPVNNIGYYRGVLRAMAPGAPGYLLNAIRYTTTGDSISGSLEIPENVLDKRNLRLIFFVQNNETREIYQAAQYPDKNITVGLEEEKIFVDNVNHSIEVYPNPTKDNAILKVTQAINLGDLRFYNALGIPVSLPVRKLDDYRYDLHLGHLSSGIYMVEAVTKTGHVLTHRFVISN